ncbi:MAG: hypothetical protein IJ153_06085 [Clostridia bacterium]|nr:hypothetical protein [Clostridia bacterium]
MTNQVTLQTTIDLINKAMVNTQNLQLQPTEHNVNLIAESLKSLRNVAAIVNDLFATVKMYEDKAKGEPQLIIEQGEPEPTEEDHIIQLQAEVRDKM